MTSLMQSTTASCHVPDNYRGSYWNMIYHSNTHACLQKANSLSFVNEISNTLAVSHFNSSGFLGRGRCTKRQGWAVDPVTLTQTHTPHAPHTPSDYPPSVEKWRGVICEGGVGENRTQALREMSELLSEMERCRGSWGGCVVLFESERSW